MKHALQSLGMFVGMLLSSILILVGVALVCVAALHLTDRAIGGREQKLAVVQSALRFMRAADGPSLCFPIKPKQQDDDAQPQEPQPPDTLEIA